MNCWGAPVGGWQPVLTERRASILTKMRMNMTSNEDRGMADGRPRSHFPETRPRSRSCKEGREDEEERKEERKSWELKQGSCELGALTLHARVLQAIKHFSSPIKLCQRSLTQPIRLLPGLALCVLRMRVAYRHLEWLLGRVEGFSLPAIPTHLYLLTYGVYRLSH